MLGVEARERGVLKGVRDGEDSRRELFVLLETFLGVSLFRVAVGVHTSSVASIDGTAISGSEFIFFQSQSTIIVCQRIMSQAVLNCLS